MPSNMTKSVSKTDIVRQCVESTERRLTQINIDIPPDFSAVNALRAAQIMIEQDENLRTCTPDSIRLAMLKIIVLGLNPAKNQVYLIPRKGRLCADISYFGSMALVKRFCGALKISNNIIYEKDEFIPQIDDEGKEGIPIHKRASISNLNGKIVGAYTVIKFPDNDFHVEIMTYEQIKKSWKKSKYYNSTSVHNEYPEEMCKRTVCRKACKNYLNSSGDFTGVKKELESQGIKSVISEEANQTELDFQEPESEIKNIQDDIPQGTSEEHTDHEHVSEEQEQPKQEEPAPMRPDF